MRRSATSSDLTCGNAWDLCSRRCTTSCSPDGSREADSMFLSSCGDAEIRVERQQAAATRRERVGVGLICSVLLHVAAALLIVLGLPRLMQAPPELAQVVPVDLVRLGE